MPRRRVLCPRPALDEAELRCWIAEQGCKSTHCASTISQIVTNGVGCRWSDLSGLPSALLASLPASFSPCTSSLLSSSTSSDARTTKLLLALQDGLTVEAVIMRHDPSEGLYCGRQRPGTTRATLCISTQVGCQMGCSFCATGTMGLKGNLTAGEILEQLLHATGIATIRNVVFMGMGEPLNNYDAVKQAIATMTAPHAFRLSPNHITVSTVGVVPRMLSFAADMPAAVNLALSLHAPTQELRQQLVPAARAYPLPKLLSALHSYQQQSGKRVFVEYVLLDGVNDALSHAHQLGALLASKDVVVNLIPYNTTDVAATYRPSRPEAARAFQKVLREGYGLRTTVRREMGQDIAGACGQLAVRQPNASSPGPDSVVGLSVSRSKPSTVRDIEDLVAPFPGIERTALEDGLLVGSG